MGSQPVGISASRGSAILGVSPYMTPVQVWLQIMEERQPGFCASRGYTLPESVADKPSVRWGTAFEDAVCELAERATGLSIRDRERAFKHTEHEFVTCHIDGEYFDDATYGPLHEGKTTTDRNLRENWGDPGTDKVPVQYQVQTQHQMLCTGARRDIISVLAFPKSPEDWEETGLVVGQAQMKGGSREWIILRDGVGMLITCSEFARNLALMGYFHQFPVDAKPEAQQLMLERYRLFWERNVLPGVEPEPASQDDMRRLFPAPSGTLIITDEMETWLDEIALITAETGTTGPLNARKERLKTAVIDAARKMDRTVDDESREKTIFLNSQGVKRATWNGKTLTQSHRK